MKKLKNKIFLFNYLVLTFCLITVIVIFNVQKYVEVKRKTENALKDIKENNLRAQNNDKKNEPFDNKRFDLKYMDNDVYTILIDDNDNIKEIINQSNSKYTTQINDIAKGILEKDVIYDEYIGNLYLNDYSYVYIKGNSLSILNNKMNRENLLFSLKMSLMIFILLEMLFYFITNKVADKIVTPVNVSFEKQKTFVADASHELKTPLAIIVASLDEIKRNPKKSKQMHENIINETKKMNKLISLLLSDASYDSLKGNLFENKNLSKILELSILPFDAVAYEKNVKIDYDIKENICMKLDENAIKELISILIDNAIKHSYENETIYIKLYLENNNIVFTVQNTGDEISKEDSKKIFERFYKIDKSRNRNDNSFGLGLAIAKTITEKHNGNIGVESKDNKVIFKVTFKK